MASVIANQFGEADGLKLISLIAIGLLLFLITAIINFIGKLIMKKLSLLMPENETYEQFNLSTF